MWRLTSQNERGNATNETGQKRIEWESADEATVAKLDNAC